MTWNDLLDRINSMTDEEKNEPARMLDENDLDDDDWSDSRKAKYCDTVAVEIDNVSSFIDPLDGIRKYVMTP